MLRAWQLLLYSKWPTYFAYAAYAHLSKVFEARVGCQVYRNQFPHCWLRALRVAPRGWRNRNRFGSLLHTARVRWSSKSKMVCIYIHIIMYTHYHTDAYYVSLTSMKHHVPRPDWTFVWKSPEAAYGMLG